MPANDLKAMSTLLDEKLKPIHGEIARVKGELVQVKATAARSYIALDNVQRELARIDSDLTTANEKLDEHTKTLGEHSGKLDALTADMMQVQQKVGATYDLVHATFESNKREIDEIKEHVGLPVIPSPFESH